MTDLERRLTAALERLSEQYETEQRIARGLNPSRKSANYLQDCTICVSCRWTGRYWTVLRKREKRIGMAGLAKPFKRNRSVEPWRCAVGAGS